MRGGSEYFFSLLEKGRELMVAGQLDDVLEDGAVCVAGDRSCRASGRGKQLAFNASTGATADYVHLGAGSSLARASEEGRLTRFAGSAAVDGIQSEE